jgi:ArsR family transcriptional regulator
MAPWRLHHAGVNDSTVVEQFKALGDPVRWAIVSELRGGLRCACELADIAEVSPPLLSHHLKVLREAGLINGTRRGRWVDYTLDRDALTELFAVFELEAVA